MEKPTIISEFEPEIAYDFSLAKEKDNKLNYYSYFIGFLEERLNEARMNGDIRIYKGGGGGILKKIGSHPSFAHFGTSQIEYGIKYLKQKQKEETGKAIVEQGTTRQTTLAFYYMEKSAKFPRHSGEFTIDASFIRFLTGKSFDNIRKILSEPLKREDTKISTMSLLKDLQIVQNEFKQISFIDGVKLIENDIIKVKNDLESFKEV